MVEIEDVEATARPSDMPPPATTPKKPEVKKVPFSLKDKELRPLRIKREKERKERESAQEA